MVLSSPSSFGNRFHWHPLRSRKMMPLSICRGNLDLAEQVGSYISSLVLHGLESLRVLKQAAWHRRLTDPQVEDIFYGNLARLLEIED